MPSSRDFEKQAKDFKAELQGLFASSFEEVSKAMQIDDIMRAADEIRNIFDTATRQGLALGEALSSADLELNRKALKAQENIFKLKMEASRTAAAVQMKNQAAELEASAKAAADAKRREALEGGDTELLEAQDEIERLGKANHHARIEIQRQEELIKTMTRDHDKEMRKLEKELGQLEAKRAEEQEAHANEIYRLEERARSAEEALEEAEARVEEVEEELRAGSRDMGTMTEMEEEIVRLRRKSVELAERLAAYEVDIVDEEEKPPERVRRISRERFDELEEKERQIQEMRVELKIAITRAETAEEKVSIHSQPARHRLRVRGYDSYALTHLPSHLDSSSSSHVAPTCPSPRHRADGPHRTRAAAARRRRGDGSLAEHGAERDLAPASRAQYGAR